MSPLADYLQMWVIYDRPIDFPHEFVARLHLASAGEHGPTNRFVTGTSLQAVRKQLPKGLIPLQRHPDDDPKIVEVWL